MNKSLVIQFGILTVILLISYFSFSYINNTNISELIDLSKSNKNKEIQLKTKVSGDSLQSNKILDLSYKSNDEKGNIYEIKSVSGSVDEEDVNILILENVTAKILIFNYGTLLIKSHKARYNKLSLDTHFFDKVSLVYQNHGIKSDDVFLRYIDKEVKISNNVKYNYENSLLESDEIYLDLISKTSKIYMNDQDQKVKAIIKD